MARPEDWPILCETCLGDNPFIRMTKEPHGKACKICDRAFTVYRWRPGKNARYKKTELCLPCAKLKNVCQTCVLDLQYGLPVQVRDSTLEEHEKVSLPKDELNREYAVEQLEKDVNADGVTQSYSKVAKPNQLLSKLRRTQPYYKRNESHLCSFYAKGTCNRGAACPYRHEMPTTGELANQNIKDRYYGHNDPVAKKMLNRTKAVQEKLPPPEDLTITTLYVGNLDEKITEADLREKFSPFGAITSIHIAQQRNCAFVTYAYRSAAEDAANKLVNNLVINGQPLRLDWGKKPSSSAPPGMRPRTGTVDPLVLNRQPNKYLTLPQASIDIANIPAPPGLTPIQYPSQRSDFQSTKLSIDQ